MSDDLTLHPRVRQAIYEGNRDKPLTLNWAPTEPDAYDCLRLPALSNRNAMKARTQIITEALAAGDRFISYSRDKQFHANRCRDSVKSTLKSFRRGKYQKAAQRLVDAPPCTRGDRKREAPSC
jgi:hypothetical protein